jgi:DNA invertase Pin-like site-specific DNA recombinase
MALLGMEQMDQANSTDSVLWHIDARGVAYVTLNRPQVYNAYNGDMIAGLLATFDKLARETLRAVVIIGKGRNFQAGADINWLDTVRRSPPQDNLRASRMTAEAIQRLNAPSDSNWWEKTGIDPSSAARVLWLKTHPLPSAIGAAGSKLQNEPNLERGSP